MDTTLVEAWKQIEKTQLLLEKKKIIASKIKAKTKKLKEDGVGGPNGAGVGAASNSYAKGDTMTKSGHAAVAPKKIGKKKVAEAVKDDATNAVKQSLSNIKSGKGSQADATLVGTVVSEEDAEIAAIDHNKDIAGEEAAEDVSVDAETAEQIVNAIQAQYPGAIITISVELPDEQTFDTDVVAAAQEVTNTGEEQIDLDSQPEELTEKRKVIVAKTRKQIKELFARMKEDGELGDEELNEPSELETGIDDLEGGDDIAADLGTEEQPTDSIVTDTKIALTPEQWGQVMATTDLLNGPSEDEPAIDGVEPAETDIQTPDQEIDELQNVYNLDQNKIVKDLEVEPSDEVHDDEEVPVTINENFKRELGLYAQTLNKLLK